MNDSKKHKKRSSPMVPFLKLLYIHSFLALFLACSPQAEAPMAVIEEPVQAIEEVTPDDPPVKTKGGSDDGSITILFVGNSLTYTNNLPKLVTDAAKGKEIAIGVKMIAKPNYAIVDHLDFDTAVRTEIESKKYDFVVVQQGPSSQSEGRELLFEAGKRLSALCLENDAKLVFFMVWPSRAYYHTFDGVIKNHTEAAQAHNALLSPVGKVWKAHFDATGDFSYYGPDQFHPSVKGSTVAAQVILNTILQSL